MSRHKECVSELSGVRREASRRAHQSNSQTREEISRWLGTLEIKTMQRKTQSKVIEHSEVLFQEGIKLVKRIT
jgi:hypothetical protein